LLLRRIGLLFAMLSFGLVLRWLLLEMFRLLPRWWLLALWPPSLFGLLQRG